MPGSYTWDHDDASGSEASISSAMGQNRSKQSASPSPRSPQLNPQPDPAMESLINTLRGTMHVSSPETDSAPVENDKAATMDGFVNILKDFRLSQPESTPDKTYLDPGTKTFRAGDFSFGTPAPSGSTTVPLQFGQKPPQVSRSTDLAMHARDQNAASCHVDPYTLRHISTARSHGPPSLPTAGFLNRARIASPVPTESEAVHAQDQTVANRSPKPTPGDVPMPGGSTVPYLSKVVPDTTTPTAGSVPTESRAAHVQDQDAGPRPVKPYKPKHVSIPRGNGPPSLFAAVPDTTTATACPSPVQMHNARTYSATDDAQPSAKRRAYLEIPEGEIASEPSPTKRQFGRSKAPDVAPAAKITVGSLIETFRRNPVGTYTQDPVGFSAPAHATKADNYPSTMSFPEWASLAVDLYADDREAHSVHLKALHEYLVSFSNVVASNTEGRLVNEKAVSEYQVEAEALQKVRDAMIRPHDGDWPEFVELDRLITDVHLQQGEAKRQLANYKSEAKKCHKDLMRRMREYLEILAEYYQAKYANHILKTDAETKHELINQLRLASMNLEEDLKSTKGSLKVSNDTVEQLRVQRKVDELKVANATKALQDTHRAKLDKGLTDQKAEYQKELTGLKDRYATQINDAEAKFRMYKEATAQMEKFKATVQCLEREKADMLLAKAAREKELDDLERQAAQRKDFEDAYKQVKIERDQLETELNDAVAERDDLRHAIEAMPVAPSANSVAVNAKVTTAPSSGAGALKSTDRDLALLESFWAKQRNVAEMAKRETQAQIDEVEKDTNDIARELAPFEEPEESEEDTEAAEAGDEDDVTPPPPMEPPRPSQMLDTLLSPVPWGASTPVPNPAMAQGPPHQPVVPQIGRPPTQHAPKKSMSLADRVAGRAPPAAHHEMAAQSIGASKLEKYQGDKVSTAKRTWFQPLNATAGAFLPGKESKEPWKAVGYKGWKK
jgi:hypothetical protein